MQWWHYVCGGGILVVVIGLAGYWVASKIAKPDVDKLKANRNVPKLVKALGHWAGTVEVSEAAITALAEIGAPAVNPLIATLQARDWYRRKYAAEALGRIGDPRAVDPLVASLRDENWEVGAAAAKALGQIGDERAVQPLTATIKDVLEVGGTRTSAMLSLSKIAGPQALEILAASLQDEHGYIRLCAAKELARHGDARAVPVLVNNLTKAQDPPVSNQPTVTQALESLGTARISALLRDKTQDCEVREQAAYALGWIHIDDQHAVKALVEGLKDEHATVREQCKAALARMGNPHVIPAGMQIWEWLNAHLGRRCECTFLRQTGSDDYDSREEGEFTTIGELRPTGGKFSVGDRVFDAEPAYWTRMNLIEHSRRAIAWEGWTSWGSHERISVTAL